MKMTQQISINTPFGSATLTQKVDQISIVLSTNHPNIQAHSVSYIHHESILKIIVDAIVQYLEKPNHPFNLAKYLPIETLKGTDYQKRVWQAIVGIPVGQTISYTDIAITLHSSPRAVANACGANSLPILIPCHRVVAKHGIGGFMRGNADGLIIKQWLLNHEGVNFA